MNLQSEPSLLLLTLSQQAGAVLSESASTNANQHVFEQTRSEQITVLEKPQSYFDWFLLFPELTYSFLKDITDIALAVYKKVKVEKEQKSWLRRTGSLLFHIWIICIFETIFSYRIGSESEDRLALIQQNQSTHINDIHNILLVKSISYLIEFYILCILVYTTSNYLYK